jgi:hypothetical protein
MAADYPPLNKFYTASYAANDRDYPVVAIRLDPRTAGYKVPEDLSPHPDSKRYPNHVFTGATPSSGDQVVTHVYEILPSPWVPFTRYDDDLGPIQSRRRSVKNEGQVASLTADKRVTYEAREGSAIVYTEIEEVWSIKTDDDGNSLFPVKTRDFYDASRGAIQETRQLFVPTGEEVGTLENIDGVITQTSYEVYNEYLSFKVVQTYSVNGPQLVGQATDNDKQLVTITTQRKAADGYIPPSPTATRSIEVSREDAESLIERITDTPEIFTAKTFTAERPDITPQKFRALIPLITSQENVEGNASQPVLLTGEFSKSEQQVDKFVKRISTTSRQINNNVSFIERVLTNDRQIGTRIVTLSSGAQSFTPSATLVDANIEELGDGTTVKTEITVPSVFDSKTISAAKPDVIPEQFSASNPLQTTQETIAQSSVSMPSLGINDVEKSEQRVTEFTVRKIASTRSGSFPELRGQEYEPQINIYIPFTEKITPSGQNLTNNATNVDPLSSDFDLVREFDLDSIRSQLDEFMYEFPTRANMSLPSVLKSVKVTWDSSSEDSKYSSDWSGESAGTSASLSGDEDGDASSTATVTPSFSVEIDDTYGNNIPTTSYFFFLPHPVTLNDILTKVNATQWPVFKPKSFVLSAVGKTVSVSVRGRANQSVSLSNNNVTRSTTEGSGDSVGFSNRTVTITIPPTLNGGVSIIQSGTSSKTVRAEVDIGWPNLNNWPAVEVKKTKSSTITGSVVGSISSTNPPDIPKSGKYLIDSRVENYQYGYAKIFAEVVDASVFA